jgi:hypothetical protein
MLSRVRRRSASRRHVTLASTLATALRQAHVGVQENVGRLIACNPLHRPADLMVIGLDDDPADRPWVVVVSVMNPTPPRLSGKPRPGQDVPRCCVSRPYP